MAMADCSVSVSMPTSRWRRWRARRRGAYRQVLAWKGAILERQRRLRDLRGGSRPIPRPEAARRRRRLSRPRRPAGHPGPGQPGPKQAGGLAPPARRPDRTQGPARGGADAAGCAAFRAARAEASRTPEQLQAALPRDAALIDLLEYTRSSPPPKARAIEFERRLVAFVVRPDRPIARVDLGPLAPILAGDRRLAADPGRREAAPGGQATRRRRCGGWSGAPWKTHLAGVATVLVSPDGALGLVPLAALPGKEPSSLPDRGAVDRPGAGAPDARLSRDGRGAGLEGSGAAQAEPVRRCCWSATSITAATPARAATAATSRSAAVGTRAGLLPDFKACRRRRRDRWTIRDSFEEHFPDARAA